MRELFTPVTTRLLDVAPRGGRRFDVLGHPYWLKAGSDDTSGAFTLFETELAPGEGPPLHIHHGDDEAFYVLAGAVAVQAGRQVLHASAGEFLLLPRGTPHQLRVVSDVPARLLVMTSPAGIEALYERLDQLGRQGPLDRNEAVRIAAEFGVELIGEIASAT